MNDTGVLAGRRILFVLPSLELGGAERQALLLARYLKGEGCTVSVWGFFRSGLAAEMCDQAGIAWRVVHSVWPCQRRHLPRAVLRMLHFVLALKKERPDVILAYGPRASVSAGLTWRWSGASLCLWGQRAANDLRGDWVERLAYRNVSAIICNAEHERGYLARTLGHTEARLFVVHNGVALAPAQRSRREWRAELGLSMEVKVVTMVANFRPNQKGHDLLLHAWQRVMKGCAGSAVAPVLVLAGGLPDGCRAMRELARTLDLDDAIRFPGQVSDVAGLLAASDIGVLISASEGLPNAVIEYMASGLPVVASDIPANREVLGDGPAQPLCEHDTPAAIAQRLLALLLAPGLDPALPERNRQRASAEFSVAAMCERSVAIMNTLLIGRS